MVSEVVKECSINTESNARKSRAQRLGMTIVATSIICCAGTDMESDATGFVTARRTNT